MLQFGQDGYLRITTDDSNTAAMARSVMAAGLDDYARALGGAENGHIMFNAACLY
jgi:hypothetical protein